MSDQFDRIRQLATAAAAQADGISKAYEAQMTSVQKWIIASLLSVNGAPIFALWSTHDLAKHTKFFASVWYFAGVSLILIFALLYEGVLSSRAGVYHRLSTAWGKWFRDPGSGEIQELDSLAELLDPISSRERLVNKLRPASLICFLVASGIVAQAMW